MSVRDVVGERANLIVVDPHVEPPNPMVPELHVYVVEGDLTVEMRDYPSGAALEAVRL